MYVTGCKSSRVAQAQRALLADHMHHIAIIATAVLRGFLKVVGKHIGVLPQAKLIFSHVESLVAILCSDEQEDKTNKESASRHGNDGYDAFTHGSTGAIDCGSSSTCTFWNELGCDGVFAIGVPFLGVGALFDFVTIADLWEKMI